MQNALFKQQGLTFISMIVLLAFIGFLVLLVLKIGPIYLNNNKLADAVEAIQQSPGLANKTVAEIRTDLDKQFNMNYVDYITVADGKIVAQPGYVKVAFDYERVEHIIGNLSVLVEFHEGFETGKR